MIAPATDPFTTAATLEHAKISGNTELQTEQPDLARQATEELGNLNTILGKNANKDRVAFGEAMVKMSKVLEPIIAFENNKALEGLRAGNAMGPELGKVRLDQRAPVRRSYATDLVKGNFNSTRPMTDFVTTDLGGRVSLGQLPADFVTEVQAVYNAQIVGAENELRAALSDTDPTKRIKPSELEAKIDALTPNPDVRIRLKDAFKQEIRQNQLNDEAKKLLDSGKSIDEVKRELDKKVKGIPARGARPAVPSSMSQVEADSVMAEIKDSALNRQRELVDKYSNHTMTLDEVRSEIAKEKNPYTKGLLLQAFQAEIAGSEFQATVDAIGNISGVANARAALDSIINSAEFSKYPPAQARALKEAAAHQIERIAGTDDLYQLEENKITAERNLRVVEINRKTWERRKITIRRLALPVGIAVGVALMSGLGVGAAVDAPTIFKILAGLGTAAAVGGASYGIERGINWAGGRLNYVSASAAEIAKIDVELQNLLAENQKAYNNIHTVQAERASMPLQALNEISKLAAESAWIRSGRNSGIPKEQWVNSFLEQTNLSELDALRQSISKMTLTPSSTPLT